MKIFLNGEIIDQDQHVDIFEPGFLFGWGVFETLRVYNKRPAFLAEHLARMQEGSRVIELEYPDIDYASKIQELLEKNGLDDAYCRITLFKKRKSTGVTIYVSKFAYYTEEDYQRGFRAVVSQFRRDSQDPLLRVKGISYLANRLAWKKAQDAGKEEALLMNEEGYLSEGSRTNVFFIKDSVVFTPALECGMLPGITRAKVIEIIKNLQIELVEGKFDLKDLMGADEAFLTSSLMEVMPLVEVDGQRTGEAKPETLTLDILSEYRKYIQKI